MCAVCGCVYRDGGHCSAKPSVFAQVTTPSPSCEMVAFQPCRACIFGLWYHITASAYGLEKGNVLDIDPQVF